MKKLKQALSLTLALALSLALAVPAMAVGTTEKITLGSTVLTVTNVLKVVNERYNMGTDPVYDDAKITGQDEFTIFVVSDSGYTRTLEAAPGYIYDRSGLSEAEAMKVAEWGYMSFGWTSEQKYFFELGGNASLMDKPETYTNEAYSPIEDSDWVTFVDWNYSPNASKHIGILYESEYAKLVPAGGQSTTPVQPAPAMPTNDKLTVDGVLANPTVYKIDGSNYFKIRDVAALLNGTGKQFSVGYDNALKSVTATTGQGYDKLDSDLAGAPTGGNQTATPSNDTIYVNGEKIDATVYKIDGGNYFKLRDLGKALNFSVDWSRDAGMMIDTGKPYSE